MSSWIESSHFVVLATLGLVIRFEVSSYPDHVHVRPNHLENFTDQNSIL
jgi:hypothetical protein